jgi:hypothetical protein
VAQINQSKFGTPILVMLILGLTTFIFASSIEANIFTTNIAYGQNKPSPPSLRTTIPHKTSLHAIRITSPIRGQEVAVGENLVVSGISAPGNSTASSSCHVSVIVNGIKPYQNASGIGPKGQNDYSKWTFLLIPKYTTVKQGTNKITSKFSCDNNPSLVSYYSVNVTGSVGAGASSSRTAPAATINKPPGIITPH